MSDKYTFLFPYERIPFGSRILIYGAGDMGYEYAKQIIMTAYANVIGLVDRDKDRMTINGLPLFSIEDIDKIDFDYVVIALKSGANAEQAINDLVSIGVVKERLVWIGPRNESDMSSYEEYDKEDWAAYKKEDCVSVAIRCGSGIGDLIIRKKFIEALCSYSDRIGIDLYAPLEVETIDAVYSDCNQVTSYIKDGGGKYMANKAKYDLALTCSYLLCIDYVDEEGIEKKSALVASAIRKLKDSIDSYGLSLYPCVQNKLHYERAAFKGENCITAYNYTGICDIRDDHVNIPLKSEYEARYRTLGLGNYVTVNYGNDLNKNGNNKDRMISKQWPISYFEKLTELIKKAYPNIDIVQLGTKNADGITGVDRYILGESLETVKYILKESIVHIDIEGGLVHIATQLGTKCIVIFGPTDASFFGYKRNFNIVSSACNNCSALYSNIYRCARDLDEPECMYSITPELVMTYVDEYMQSIGIAAK